MKKKPKVSVIMSVYNGMPHLKKSVESILNQTYKNFEFIIVDDASADKTGKYLVGMKDKRLKIIKNKKNLGLAKSLNFALSKARGDYIARMDADDISVTRRFEEQIKFLEKNKKVSLCGSWAQLIDDKGREIDKRKYPTKPSKINFTIPFINPIIHPSVMARRDFFETVGYYNPKFEMSEDYELWLRARKKVRMANIPKFLIKLRVSKEQRSHKELRKMEKSEIRARIKNLNDIPSFLGLTKKLLTFFIPTPYKVQ